MSAVSWREWLRPRRVAAILLAAYGSFFAITCARILAQAGRDEAKPADAIVVFGAAEYYEQKLAPVIITTGGSGGEERFTEGSVGRDYLIERGIRDAHLIAETQSDNSAESAERIGTIMAANNMRSCIAVSDPYHEFRIKNLLEAQGRTVYASPRHLETGPKSGGRALRVAREALSYTLWRLYIFRLRPELHG